MSWMRRLSTYICGAALVASCIDPSGPDDTPPVDFPIVFMRLEGENWEVFSIRSDGSTLRRLTNRPGDDLYPVWMPGHTRIAFQSDRLGGWLYTMDPAGVSVQLAFRNLSCSCHDYALRFAVSPDGARAVVGQLRLLTLGDTAIGPSLATGSHVTWSRTDRILYTGVTGVESIRPDGTDRLTLVSGPAAKEPALSPDGKWLAYSRETANGTFIMVARANGTQAEQVTRAEPGVTPEDLGASWSPNSEYLTFQRGYNVACPGGGGQFHIAVVRRDGKNFRNLTRSAGCGLNVRPAW